MKRILITSALPYVNNVPHLGNIIGCVLSADAISRFFKQEGRTVLFICGADEYGTSTEVKAEEEGLTPRQLCDKYIEVHKNIYNWFQIEFDHFGRTSTQDPKNDDWNHTKISQDIFSRLANNGFLIERKIDQLYCEELDRFLADRYVVGKCPKCFFDRAKGDQCDNCGSLLNGVDLIDPFYKINPDFKLVVRETEHLFLDLESLQGKLEKWFERESINWSKNAVSITKSWFSDGLKPRCVTRDLKWGTPVPHTEKFGDKFEGKVMYNWFDAPIGYISITSNHTNDWENWWKNPDGVELIQTFAKDNCPFHSLIFPASLIGTGQEYTLVNKISSVNYLNYEGQKFSKSNGVGVFGDNAIETGLPSDLFRFYLLIQRPERKDSEFTWGDFQDKINSILNDNLGNLIQRILIFTYKKFDATVPEMTILQERDWTYINTIRKLATDYNNYMSNLELKSGILTIIEISTETNRYINREAPWNSIKTDTVRCGTVINLLAHTVGLISRLLFPFMPSTSKQISQYLNFEYTGSSLVLDLITGIKINEPKALFRKITDKEIDKFRNLFGGGIKLNSP